MAAVTWSALVLLALQILFSNVIECCIMKNSSIDVDYMVYDSKFIILGDVARKITPDPRTPSILTSYGIELNIKCIYKGDVNDVRLKDKDNITIAGAGIVKEGCYSLEGEVDSEIIVFLNEDGNHLVPSYGTVDIVPDPYELVIACDLNPVGPRGQAIDSQDCPASNAEPDCMKYVPPTPPPTTGKPITTKMPVKVVTLSKKAPVVTPEPSPKDPKNPEKDVQTKSDPENTASILSVNLAFSLVLCLLSAVLMS